MSGQIEGPDDGWTLGTLYIYFQRQITDLRASLDERSIASDKALQIALLAAEKAVTKAETAAEKRFEACVSADTPVLCADMTWRPAGDLLVGDELIAFDESSPTRRGRRFRRSIVTANSLCRDTLLLVNTPAGSVRCNYRHPWLVRRQDKTCTWRWVNAEDLRPGDVVLNPVDVWETDRSWDAGWLAGMYDGEGCLCFDRNGSVQLTMSQRVSPTADRMTALIKTLVPTAGVYVREPNPSHAHPANTDKVEVYVNARADVLKMLGVVRPARLLVDADKVWDGKPLGGRHRTSFVTSVEGAGTGMIASLTTSTHTYIAGGFAMHNTNEFRGQLSDQAATFMPRTEAEADNQRHLERIAELAARLDKAEGSDAGAKQTIVLGSMALSAVLAVVTTVSLIIAFSR